MLKKIVITTALSSLLFSQTLAEFKAQQAQGYQTYKKTQEEGFKAYKQEQMKAFNEYKKEISEIWDKPEMSTKKSWVAYSEDKKTRTNVNFEDETIMVETVAKSPEEAKRKLQMALAKVVTTDTKTVQKNRPFRETIS